MAARLVSSFWSGRTETGQAGEITQVDFLVTGLEEKAENFCAGLGKEIGERAHCSLFVNVCSLEVNNKNHFHEKIQSCGSMTMSQATSSMSSDEVGVSEAMGSKPSRPESSEVVARRAKVRLIVGFVVAHVGAVGIPGIEGVAKIGECADVIGCEGAEQVEGLLRLHEGVRPTLPSSSTYTSYL